jgi:exoribonuclease R
VRVRRAARDAGAAIQAGLDAIRDELDVPSAFPPDAEAAAEQAATRDPTRSHVDRTDVEFRTIDPASSTDLDQAFAIELAGSSATDADIVLRYAIADVGFFVDHGDAIDREAWRRGSTVYLPGARAPLYPSVLSESAASLLPAGPRPAVVFIVRIDTAGNAVLDGAERAVIRSRAKLAYDSVRPEDLPAAFAELSRRIVMAEDRRQAPRVEFPEQELVRVDGRWVLRFDPRLESEDQNAGMSLATNLAVADALFAAKTGLFRVMPDVADRAVGRLRHSARAFGLDWPRSVSLADFQRSLPRDDPRANAFLLAVRRASGGAHYEPYVEGHRPWHAAMAATYAHATAPLRRLADRYVVETALAVVNGRVVADDVTGALESLPEVMEQSERLGSRVDSAVRDLAEAVALAGREGDVFDGVVVDEDDRGAVMQIAEPAVIVRLHARRVVPGDPVRAKLVKADPTERRVEFERVG